MASRQSKLPIQLLQGQKANSQTQYVESLQINVSGILMPLFGVDGYMQQEPGLTQYGTGEGVDRGGVWNDNFQKLFRVSGNSLITVDADGTTTILGTSTRDLISPIAAMPYSFNSQAIVVDGIYYRYTPTGGVAQITNPVDTQPIDCVWVDGYYFFTDGEFIFHTDLNDETVIDPLAYSVSQFSPDRSKGVGLTTDDKVIVFNRFTIEYFENVANEFFAFTRIPARTVQYGIIDTFTKCQLGGDWFFMGGPAEGNISIFQLQVGTAKNISCKQVDKIIAQYSEADLRYSVLEIRVIEDYPYLLVHLPNEVLMLNFKVGAAAGPERGWTILQSGLTSGNPYRAIHGVYDPRRESGKQWTYGDKNGATLGYLDFEVATQYDALVANEMTTPLYYLEAQSIDELMIQTIPGFTATDDAGVFFSISFDAGVTWSSEFIMAYGGPSQYGQRFMAYALGYVNNFFSFKFRSASRSRMAFSAGSIRYG